MDAIAIFNPIISSGISGYVKFHQCDNHIETQVEFNLSGFIPRRTHAIHIHAFGISSIENACDSTCSHYNPHNKLHGSNVLHGCDRHTGDLINNLVSDKNGNFIYKYTDRLIDVKDILGRSIVIHSGIDDLGEYRSEKTSRGNGSATTGNAGGRIACSNIGILGKC